MICGPWEKQDNNVADVFDSLGRRRRKKWFNGSVTIVPSRTVASMKGIQVLPPTYLVLAMAIILGLHFLFPVVRIIAFPWNFFGAIPLVLGIVINILADGAFKKANTTVKPFEESTALITKGVFRISRHPMYFGFVLILLGITILIGSMTPYIVIVLFAVFMDRVFIVVEERMLEEKFGETWQNYKGTVRRWI